MNLMYCRSEPRRHGFDAARVGQRGKAVSLWMTVAAAGSEGALVKLAEHELLRGDDVSAKRLARQALARGARG